MATRDDQFWGEFLGIEPSRWDLPGISIRTHVGLQGYRGLWCFRRRDHTVISAPAGWISLLRHRVGENDGKRLLDESFLAELLGVMLPATRASSPTRISTDADTGLRLRAPW